MATRVSKALARALCAPGEQRRAISSGSKYGAVKTTVGDITFDSRGEAERWLALRLLQRAGEITDLERQVSYDLTVSGVVVAKFRPDFRYRRSGELVIEDFKSPATMTAVFRLKRKLLKAIYGLDVEIVQ